MSRALACAGLIAFACGDGNDTYSFNPESVPPDKPVEDLDEDEQDAFCDEVLDWAQRVLGNDLARIQCATEGILAGSGSNTGMFDVAVCNEAKDACLANPPDDAIDPAEFQCDGDGLVNCDGTVADYADCLEETARTTRHILQVTTCERIGAGDVPDEESLALSAECEALFDSCEL